MTAESFAIRDNSMWRTCSPCRVCPLREPRRSRIGVLALLLGVQICSGQRTLPGSDRPGPTEFYIVSEVISDASPFWYHYILHVKRDDRDSVVRYMRIAPLDSMCPHSVIVKAATVRLPGISPSELAARYNLCSVDSVALDRKIQRRIRTAAIDDSVRFGIVANCGSGKVVLHLPYPEQVKLERLRKSSPELARWWDLSNVIKLRAFGAGQVFYNVSAEQEDNLQREGEISVSEIRSGRFDDGLRPDCSPGKPCKPQSFRDELLGYVGPAGFWGRVTLAQANEYRFKRYVPPKYPPIAAQAKILGKVKLELSVEANTGDVRDVRVILGHPIFLDAVKQAVQQWQFAEQPDGGWESVPVDLVYKWGCPGPLAP